MPRTQPEAGPLHRKHGVGARRHLQLDFRGGHLEPEWVVETEKTANSHCGQSRHYREVRQGHVGAIQVLDRNLHIARIAEVEGPAKGKHNGAAGADALPQHRSTIGVDGQHVLRHLAEAHVEIRAGLAAADRHVDRPGERDARRAQRQALPGHP